MTLRSALARRLLPRLVAGTLPVWAARLVHAWVREDAQLTALYDAERRAETNDNQLSSSQLELIESLILADHNHVDGSLSRRVPAFVAGGALAAAAAVLFLVVRTPTDAERGQHISVGDLEARGQRLASAPLGVKVTCLSSDAKRVLGTATAGARQSGGRLACPLGSVLAFSTTNLAQEPRHLFVVGVAGDGKLRFYSPFDEAGASLLMPPGKSDALLSTLADTKNMPKDDGVSLFVLVSDKAFDARDIERQLARAEKKGVPLKSVDRLPIDVPIQSRIDMLLDAR